MRLALISAVASLATLAACEVGTIPSGTSDAPGSGSGSVDATPDAPDPNACVDRVAPGDISDAHLHMTGGTANAGQSCQQSTACHAVNSTNMVSWLYSGTIYNAAGTAPQAGVTLRIKDPAHLDAPPILKATTDSQGGFHIDRAVATVPTTYPLVVEVTACGNNPEIKQMTTVIGSAADLDCMGACHMSDPGNNGTKMQQGKILF
ncbi:MAG TPA: hypothetical protein VGM39_26250 [Kofleriaceae bacterium]|jgi:hypothetical protein